MSEALATDSPKRRKRPGVIDWLVVALVGVMLAVSVGLLFSSMLEMAKRASWMEEASAVFSGCKAYAGEHEGNFPPELGGLYPEYVERQFSLRDKEGNPLWIYHPGLNVASPPDQPLFWSREPAGKFGYAGFSVNGDFWEKPEVPVRQP